MGKYSEWLASHATDVSSAQFSAWFDAWCTVHFISQIGLLCISKPFVVRLLLIQDYLSLGVDLVDCFVFDCISWLLNLLLLLRLTQIGVLVQ